MKKTMICQILILLILSQVFMACAQELPADITSGANESFYRMIDVDYAYNLAHELSTNPLFLSSPLGTRTAGSDAEHATADFLLEEMKAIGLSDVEKIGVPVTKWQFNGASLLLDDGTEISPHSYATAATPAEGITAEILYVGEGTMADYEDIDVEGKIVLVDIDQRANWWITYPMLEAQYQGAAAILSANVSGFSEVSENALNAQDICGPTAIPCVSISVNDAAYIKEKLAEGPLTATLRVDNIVEDGGTSYNLVGRIKGKTDDEMILIGGHYDMYFNGFQDDTCAVALVLAMAKAMVASGYTPERDIVFCLHGAEEWGASNTQFDWSVGAWRMINEARPEWVGKALAFVNFELPAYAFAEYTYIASAPEMYSLLNGFVARQDTPKPENCFPEGVLTEGYQTYTYSDDFSYYAAGVPSTVNGFLLTAAQDDVFPFYYERYHSQFDDSSTFNANVMAFHIQFYGALAMYIDQTPAYLLDFGAQYDRLIEAYHADIFALTKADAQGYQAAAESLQTAAEKAYQTGEDINQRYAAAITENNVEAAESIREEAKAYNAVMLDAFKLAQDALLGLMYERPVVPHEAQQENIELMQAIVSLLREGDVVTAVDEYVWAVNNVLEWYNLFFSPETTGLVTAMFFDEANQDNQFWGTGKMFPLANVEKATRSLMAKYEEPGADFSAEIQIYEDAIVEQSNILLDNVAKEITGIQALAALLASAYQ